MTIYKQTFFKDPEICFQSRIPGQSSSSLRAKIFIVGCHAGDSEILKNNFTFNLSRQASHSTNDT